MTPAEQELLNRNFLKAAQNGRLDEVKNYLKQGADINVVDEHGYNALILAAAHSGPEPVLFLIDAGIDKDHQNDTGITALMNALVENQNMETVQALLSRKVNAALQDCQGLAAIHYAFDNLSLLNRLLEVGADINIQTGRGMTSLMMATEEYDLKTFNALLEAGADVNVRSEKSGFTALMYAVQGDEWLPVCDRILRSLVAAGADITIKDNRGRSAIDYTKYNELHEAEKYLKDCLQEQATNFSKGLSHPIKAPKPLRFTP
jgi:ankyrin repeat protein